MFLDGDAEPIPADGLITLASFSDPVEAQIVRGMLESAGVECFLIGENANELMQAAFRVWLQVRAEDESAARELMAQPAGDGPAEAVSEA